MNHQTNQGSPKWRHMRRFALIICLGTPFSIQAADAPAREPFDEAIERAMEYLKGAQAADGSWSAGRYGRDPAVSALCVMAFLSAGHVPGEGPHGVAIEKGIRAVLDAQQPNGIFSPDNRGPYEMYYQGICTLMLAEAVGMQPEQRDSKRLRERLEAAVRIILKAQRTAGEERGGWRYRVQDTDADISVTGWQLMALRAARNVGCDVPPECIEQAVAYVKRCHDPTTGGYRYQVRGSVTVACTGTAVLGLELCGKDHHRSPEALKAGSYLLHKDNALNPNHAHFFYGVYYTSQAMFQLGENYWTSYRTALHQLLLRTQAPRTAGCWIGNGYDDAQFGPNYCTAMAVLALTVEYRLLPIYQRGEDSEGGERK
jgi:hypothetical protein